MLNFLLCAVMGSLWFFLHPFRTTTASALYSPNLAYVSISGTAAETHQACEPASRVDRYRMGFSYCLGESGRQTRTEVISPPRHADHSL
jgi:hypothetical protein